jgi:hypothetical protein
VRACPGGGSGSLLLRWVLNGAQNLAHVRAGAPGRSGAGGGRLRRSAGRDAAALVAREKIALILDGLDEMAGDPRQATVNRQER